MKAEFEKTFFDQEAIAQELEQRNRELVVALERNRDFVSTQMVSGALVSSQHPGGSGGSFYPGTTTNPGSASIGVVPNTPGLMGSSTTVVNTMSTPGGFGGTTNGAGTIQQNPALFSSGVSCSGGMDMIPGGGSCAGVLVPPRTSSQNTGGHLTSGGATISTSAGGGRPASLVADMLQQRRATNNPFAGVGANGGAFGSTGSDGTGGPGGGGGLHHQQQPPVPFPDPGLTLHQHALQQESMEKRIALAQQQQGQASLQRGSRGAPPSSQENLNHSAGSAGNKDVNHILSVLAETVSTIAQEHKDMKSELERSQLERSHHQQASGGRDESGTRGAPAVSGAGTGELAHPNSASDNKPSLNLTELIDGDNTYIMNLSSSDPRLLAQQREVSFLSSDGVTPSSHFRTRSFSADPQPPGPPSRTLKDNVNAEDRRVAAILTAGAARGQAGRGSGHSASKESLIRAKMDGAKSILDEAEILGKKKLSEEWNDGHGDDSYLEGDDAPVPDIPLSRRKERLARTLASPGVRELDEVPNSVHPGRLNLLRSRSEKNFMPMHRAKMLNAETGRTADVSPQTRKRVLSSVLKQDERRQQQLVRAARTRAQRTPKHNRALRHHYTEAPAAAGYMRSTSAKQYARTPQNSAKKIQRLRQGSAGTPSGGPGPGANWGNPIPARAGPTATTPSPPRGTMLGFKSPNPDFLSASQRDKLTGSQRDTFEPELVRLCLGIPLSRDTTEQEKSRLRRELGRLSEAVQADGRQNTYYGGGTGNYGDQQERVSLEEISSAEAQLSKECGFENHHGTTLWAPAPVPGRRSRGATPKRNAGGSSGKSPAFHAGGSMVAAARRNR